MTAASTDGARELYSRGLAMPAEPRVPHRLRRVFVTLAVLFVLAVIAWIGFKLVTAGQDFDPALDPTQQFEPDGQLPGEDPAG